MNNTLYSFICDFNMEHGEIMIIDPYYNKLSSFEDKVPLDNNNILHASLLPGIYNAYHSKDWINDNISSLFLLRRDFDIEKATSQFSYCYMGNVSTDRSSSVAVIEKQFIYKTRWLYHFMGEDMIFDADRILSDVEKMPYPAEIQERIIKLCQMRKQEGHNITGKNILEILQSLPIWIGFKYYDEDSTAWTVEVINKLYSSVIDAAYIKGGVVSRTESGNHPCYMMQMDNENVGLAIHLDAL